LKSFEKMIMNIHLRRLPLMVAALALFLSLPLVLATNTFGQEEGPPDPPRDDRPMDQNAGPRGADLIERLNLNPEQIRQIRQIRRRSAEDFRNARERMKSAQVALDEAIYADSVDEGDIEAKARAFASAQADMARLRALTELQIRRVLTPDQLKTFREIRISAQLQNPDRRRPPRRDGSAFDQRRRPNPDQVKPGPPRPPLNPDARGGRP
jgi:Spy/CpxP family protein refolding chaperone